MLQYITNTDCPTPVADQIHSVIDGGCRWIQIRMKEATDEEIGQVVEAVRKHCEDTGTFLLLDDRVELAKELNVGGVHLGKEDMPCSRARTILGPAAVIGVTANTIGDIEAVRYMDIDYIGIGPYSATTTKKRLAPILGLEGIKGICAEMETKEINIPRVAVGGIKLEDIEPLLRAGVNGFAVSGAIAFASDIAGETRKFIERMPVGE